MSRLAKTPEPPYYAVIFSNTRTDGDNGYDETAGRMLELAAGYPGYLGVESVRDKDGFGITVSYWQDEDSIAAWRDDAEHLQAKRQGIDKWYADYTLRIARVER
ncbi:MAG: antibiotic biosynthesis monooxygenase [Rhodospirillaceae bacterium]|nr:antibiotic biosynthesis monooxygenase [Rhodospirillaceae bacterium]